MSSGNQGVSYREGVRLSLLSLLDSGSINVTSNKNPMFLLLILVVGCGIFAFYEVNGEKPGPNDPYSMDGWRIERKLANFMI